MFYLKNRLLKKSELHFSFNETTPVDVLQVLNNLKKIHSGCPYSPTTHNHFQQMYKDDQLEIEKYLIITGLFKDF